MTTSTRWLALALLVGSLAAVGTVWAQSGGTFDAHVNVFDSGGGKAQGGSYVLQSAAGQPAAGGSGAGGYSLNAGIITGGVAAAASPSPTVSPSPVPSVGPYKGFAPQVASDGVN
jgi:hypothetical protein